MIRINAIDLALACLLCAAACAGSRTVSARDIDDAASVLLAVSACERSGRVDEACVAAAASAARQVLPRLQASAAPSGSAP